MTGAPVTRGELLAQVRELLAARRRIDPERVHEDVRLRDDLGLDSLDIAEIGMEWATRYGVLLEPEQILNIETLREAIDYVVASTAGTAAEG